MPRLSGSCQCNSAKTRLTGCANDQSMYSRMSMNNCHLTMLLSQHIMYDCHCYLSKVLTDNNVNRKLYVILQQVLMQLLFNGISVIKYTNYENLNQNIL